MSEDMKVRLVAKLDRSAREGKPGQLQTAVEDKGFKDPALIFSVLEGMPKAAIELFKVNLKNLN